MLEIKREALRIVWLEELGGHLVVFECYCSQFFAGLGRSGANYLKKNVLSRSQIWVLFVLYIYLFICLFLFLFIVGVAMIARKYTPKTGG